MPTDRRSCRKNFSEHNVVLLTSFLVRICEVCGGGEWTIERMSKIHRNKQLVLTAAALLAVCALALLVFAGPSPVNAALRSALPASWQKAQLGAARPANSPPMVLALKSPPQAKATPTAPPAQAVSSDSCIGCHTSEALLKQLVPAPAVAASSMLTGTQATAYTRTMPLWQQVLVDTARPRKRRRLTAARWLGSAQHLVGRPHTLPSWPAAWGFQRWSAWDTRR